MQIIKENYDNRICVIRTNTYKKDYAHISMLVGIAKADFPQLKDEDIQVIRYAGDRYAKTYGIEFVVQTTILEDYAPISKLENY